MTYARHFFDCFAWNKLVPDQNHTIVTAGINATVDIAGAACASDGSFVAVYIPSSRAITINMSKLSGTANAFWYDPTNGTWSSAGSNLSNSGSKSFTGPGTNSYGDSDWALLLTVASSTGVYHQSSLDRLAQNSKASNTRMLFDISGKKIILSNNHLHGKYTGVAIDPSRNNNARILFGK